jgi:hypothetical protein
LPVAPYKKEGAVNKSYFASARAGGYLRTGIEWLIAFCPSFKEIENKEVS